MTQQQEPQIRVLVGGDLCPTDRDRHLFESGDSEALFHDVSGIIRTADFFIVNLECPLVDTTIPIEKSGKHLHAPTACVRGIKSSGIHAVSLANNHVMDHGAIGLKSTIDTIQKNRLRCVGAGETPEQAESMLCFEKQGVRLGFISFAEHEFSIAAPGRSGANPLSVIRYVRWIKQHGQSIDYLIVLLHSGKENYPYPSPRQQEICRFMIDEGATAVICQHSHCPCVYEEYHNGFISYGQGNLIFDPFPDPRPWLYEGYLVELLLDNKGSMNFNLIPYSLSDKIAGAMTGVRLVPEPEKTRFLNELSQQSLALNDPEKIKKEWEQLTLKLKPVYFSTLRGHSRLFRFLNRKWLFSDLFYSKQELLVLQNILRCETHKEILDTLMDLETRGKNPKRKDEEQLS